jgi:hypothetical protein
MPVPLPRPVRLRRPAPAALLASALTAALALLPSWPAATFAAAAAAPAPAKAKPASPKSASAKGSVTKTSSLPDSVLLRINGTEDVTRRRFQRAVRLLGGDPDSLTPATRDQFLELVIEQRVLALATSRDPEPWTRADSMSFYSERDNILIRAAVADEFTRIEQRRRSLGQPDLDEQAMGVAARESLMLELHPKWDEDALRLVGSYFAEMPKATANMSAREQVALAGQSPKIPAKDTTRVLVRSDLGAFTVADLLGDWRRLSSIYRPTIEDAEGVRSMVENSLFERQIRAAAAKPELAKRAEVAAVLTDRIEYHSVASYLQRELVQGIPTDSVTLHKHYRANVTDFDRPARAVLIALTLADQRGADSLARLFRVAGEAESLAFRAQRGGVNYTLAVTEAGDSLLFRRAQKAGAGSVLGPEQAEGGWRVVKVMSLEPRTTQPFSAVRSEVQRSWYEEESERRIRKRLDDLKQAARIEYNDKALRELVLSPAKPAR